MRAAGFGLHEATALADDMAGREVKPAKPEVSLVEIFLHLALRTPQSAGTHPLPHVVEEHVVQGRTRIPEVGERQIAGHEAQGVFPGVAELAAHELARDGHDLGQFREAGASKGGDGLPAGRKI